MTIPADYGTMGNGLVQTNPLLPKATNNNECKIIFNVEKL
jgi:hypothetical protein